MTTVLLEIALWFASMAVLTIAVRRAFRRRETPRPAPKRNYDALAPHAPIYGAQRAETRPVVTPGLAARLNRDAQTLADLRTEAGIWGDPALRDFPRMDWPAYLEERKN